MQSIMLLLKILIVKAIYFIVKTFLATENNIGTSEGVNAILKNGLFVENILIYMSHIHMSFFLPIKVIFDAIFLLV